MKTTRDFVATVFIVHDNKVLLVFHKKLQKWLPPGGHIDENELPEDTAIREAKEETGLDIEIVSEKDEIISNTKQLCRPEFVQLEDIEKTEDEVHQHIDLFYLAKLKTHEIKMSKESEDIEWFSLEDLEKEDIPEEVRYHAKRMIEKMNNLNLKK